MRYSRKVRLTGAQSGFSLVEMMVALAILTMVSTVAFTLFHQFMGRYQMETEVSTSTSTLQLALNQMLQEIRAAGYPNPTLMGPAAAPATVAAGFTSIGPTSISFESALDPSQTAVQTVTYALSGDALVRTMAQKGSPAAAVSTTLAKGVNSLQFTYLDQNNQPTSSTAQVCRVLVTMTVKTGTEQPSGQPMYLPMQGSADARNLCHLNPGA